MDVKTTFLDGDLEKEISMKQPEGFPLVMVSLVCKLTKSIYGLKQVSCHWYLKFWNIIFICFLENIMNQCVYHRLVGQMGVMWTSSHLYHDFAFVSWFQRSHGDNFSKSMLTLFGTFGLVLVYHGTLNSCNLGKYLDWIR